MSEADKYSWTFGSENSAGLITQNPPCVGAAGAFGAELLLRADFLLGVLTFDPGGAPLTSHVSKVQGGNLRPVSAGGSISLFLLNPDAPP